MGVKRRGHKIPIEYWIKVGKKELERAINAFKRNDYPDSVFHSQQAVEKMVKAFLEANRIIVRDHYVAHKLEKFPDLGDVKDCAIWFEMDKKWESSRYPIEVNEKILSPEDVFTKNIAKEALKKAKFVCEKISGIFERGW